MSRAGFHRRRLHGLAGLLLAGVAQACSTDRCQELCDNYNQIALRCELFNRHNQESPSDCIDRSQDPQTLKQQSDYATQQCKLDFRMSSAEETSACCKYLCFQALLNDYNAIDSSTEAGVEQQRDVCRKFRQLDEAGDSSWCQALREENGCS